MGSHRRKVASDVKLLCLNLWMIRANWLFIRDQYCNQWSQVFYECNTILNSLSLCYLRSQRINLRLFRKMTKVNRKNLSFFASRKRSKTKNKVSLIKQPSSLKLDNIIFFSFCQMPKGQREKHSGISCSLNSALLLKLASKQKMISHSFQPCCKASSLRC